MDLSAICIYCFRHHFNVSMINTSINIENIPPSSCGGFVWAYVPVRLIMVRSDRAYSMGETKVELNVNEAHNIYEITVSMTVHTQFHVHNKDKHL